MDKFPKNLAELRELLSRIRPWVAIAGVGAAALLGFYTLQAVQYWNAWKDTQTMSGEIERISRKLEKEVPSSNQVAEDLELRERRLEYLQSLFHYPDSGRLTGIVSATSWDTSVDLPSISLADPTFDDVDGMRYQIQAMGLTAQGDLRDIYRFLATLQQRAKVVSAPNVTLSGLDKEEVSAQIQLTFYLSPQLIPDDEGAD